MSIWGNTNLPQNEPTWQITPTPAYIAQRCPICEGRGTLPVGFRDGLAGSATTDREDCKHCDGKGLILVSSFGTVSKVQGWYP